MDEINKVIIMGAGPAGLTAAYKLGKKNISSTVVEQDEIVGGLAKTVVYKGYRFDIGGHRFFTKLDSVNQMWNEILPDDFITRSRLSRIHYRGKYLDYPLKGSNIIKTLGLVFCIRAGLSYIKAFMFPRKPEKSFEDWVTNRFGKMLYEAFFKSYTEKVWGIPCTELSAAWAAQRIRGLSFVTAAKNALFKSGSDGSIKTLVDHFQYPRLGPGQMWEVVTEKVEEMGSEVLMNKTVDKIDWQADKITAIHTTSSTGEKEQHSGDYFLSTIPMRDLIRNMGDDVPDKIKDSAEHLGYRDFVITALIIDKAEVNKDNWIYIHDDSVKVGRVQNFKNWSPDLVPDQSKTCLGLEHFCFEGDELWNMSDQDLIDQGKKELEKLGIVKQEDVIDGSVLRVKQAYPIYDTDYLEHVNSVRDFLAQFKNLQLIGRNGMHKYNNQDHAMLTAMLAVENILGADHNIWDVNTVEEYHEEIQKEEMKKSA